MSSIVVFSWSTWPSMRCKVLAAPVADDQLHQHPADAVALEIGAHQHGVFRLLVVGIGVKPHHAHAARPSVSSSATKAIARA